MFKFNRNSLISATAFIVAIIIGFCLSTNNSVVAQTLYNQENNQTLPLASVWDKPSTTSYNGNTKMTVYRSPNCGCCGGWITHLKKHGFEITDIKTEDMETVKQNNNLPEELASCHTAVIDGYVFEGHIPADDIKRFLTQKPENLNGLTVPAMPIGTPGMESDETKQPFAVVAFDNQGKTEVFNSYEKY